MTSDAEKEILGYLAKAWDQFRLLNVDVRGHHYDLEGFRDAINRCQWVIAHRVATRVDRTTWTKS